jgi:hypothetical protein
MGYDVEDPLMTAIDVPNRRGNITPLGRWCLEHRIAYEKLGLRAGVSRRQMIRYVTGTSLPTAFHAIALVRETGLRFEDLFGGVLAVEAAARGMIERKGER